MSESFFGEQLNDKAHTSKSSITQVFCLWSEIKFRMNSIKWSSIPMGKLYVL